MYNFAPRKDSFPRAVNESILYESLDVVYERLTIYEIASGALTSFLALNESTTENRVAPSTLSQVVTNTNTAVFYSEVKGN